MLDLARLFLSTTSYGAFRAPTEAQEIDALLRLFAIVRQNGVCLVSVDDAGFVQGFLALALVPNLFSGEVWAEEVAWFVHPDRRGGPIARALWRRAEEWARQAQAVAIKMVAPADEPAVGRLYRLQGYVAVETTYRKRL